MQQSTNHTPIRGIIMLPSQIHYSKYLSMQIRCHESLRLLNDLLCFIKSFPLYWSKLGILEKNIYTSIIFLKMYVREGENDIQFKTWVQIKVFLFTGNTSQPFISNLWMCQENFFFIQIRKKQGGGGKTNTK